MSAPTSHQVILQPPHPVEMKVDENNTVNMSHDLYTLLQGVWKRTGGLTSATVDLKGLNASVGELNTLVGVTVAGGSTVQKQLNTKANKAALGTISSQDAEDVAITGGLVSGVTISDSSITLEVGASEETVRPGGPLNVNMNDNGNDAGVETDLTGYNVQANTLSADLMFLEVEAFGTFAANANNKQLKLKFGSETLFDTGSVSINSGSWSIKARIVRTDVTQQKAITSFVSDNASAVDSADYELITENLDVDVQLFCTGDGVASNDVIQNGLIVKWYRT